MSSIESLRANDSPVRRLLARTAHHMKKFLALIGLYNWGAYAYASWSLRQRGLHMKLQRNGRDRKIIITKGNESIWLAWEHISYILDIGDSFDSYFNASEFRTQDGNKYVDYTGPRTHVMYPSRVSLVMTGLPELEEVARVYVRETRLAEGEVVLDMGAYCGGMTALFSEVVGGRGHVHAFEPDPINYDALAQNVKALELKNVSIYNLGIWETNSVVEFRAEGNMGSALSSVASRRTQASRVQAVTLSGAVALCNLKRVDVIKMDIEGAELAVIASAREVFDAYKPRLIIEPHKVRGVLNAGEICSLLRSYGYDLRVIRQIDGSLPLIAAFPR